MLTLLFVLTAHVVDSFTYAPSIVRQCAHLGSAGMRHTFNLSGIIEYNLREPVLSDLATALVAGNCFEQFDHSTWLETDASLSDTVDALERRRLVKIYEFGGRKYIALTQEAIRTGLVRLWSLSDPTPVFQIRNEIPLEDRTAFEMLLMLNNDGWTWTRACSHHPRNIETLLFVCNTAALCMQCLGKALSQGSQTRPCATASSPRLRKAGLGCTFHMRVIRIRVCCLVCATCDCLLLTLANTSITL